MDREQREWVVRAYNDLVTAQQCLEVALVHREQIGILEGVKDSLHELIRKNDLIKKGVTS